MTKLERNRVPANRRFKKKFTKSFNEEMDRLKITTDDIREKCGYSTPQIRHWVKGTRIPNARTLSELWHAFPKLNMKKLLTK